MKLQFKIAKLLLKLPARWIITMSGGRPVSIGERILDPHFQFLAHSARKQPPMSSVGVQAARQGAADAFKGFMDDLPKSVSVTDFTILRDDAPDIPARIYQPQKHNPDRPLILYAHMGGGVIGDLETCHYFCARMSEKLGAAIISVDYRLAPENPYPAGLEDMLFAYEWACTHAEKYGAPKNSVAIGGDSIGGHFSAIIAQEMKRQGKTQPVAQLLIYPATDMLSETPSMKLYGDTYPLSSDTMNWFMSNYLVGEHDLSQPVFSPLRASDLSGLAPAMVATAGFDPLVDQGKAYADKLTAQGCQTIYRCYDNLAHGFTAFTAISPAAKQACDEVIDLFGGLMPSSSG